MAKDGAGEFMEKTLEKPVSIDFEKADGDSMLTKEDVKDMIMDIVEGKVNATKEEVADFKADIIDKPITVNITELPKVCAGWVCPWGVGPAPRGRSKTRNAKRWMDGKLDFWGPALSTLPPLPHSLTPTDATSPLLLLPHPHKTNTPHRSPTSRPRSWT